jgi:hypothetical protein
LFNCGDEPDDSKVATEMNVGSDCCDTVPTYVTPPHKAYSKAIVQIRVQ